MYPIGETKMLRIKLTAEFPDISIRPPEGLEWIPTYLFAYHDHAAAAKMITWLQDNGGYPDTITLDEEQKVSGQKSWLFSDTIIPRVNFPMRINHQVWVRAAASGFGANESLYVGGLVLERPDNLELVLLEWAAQIGGVGMPQGLDALKSRIEHYRGGL